MSEIMRYGYFDWIWWLISGTYVDLGSVVGLSSLVIDHLSRVNEQFVMLLSVVVIMPGRESKEGRRPWYLPTWSICSIGIDGKY